MPRRNITDNKVVAYEIIHFMRNIKGTRGCMAIKIDLEKTYN
jgi:hypothetical protein